MRILDFVIPDSKHVLYSLPYIKGIGLWQSARLLHRLDIPVDTKVRDLTDENVRQISDYIRLNLTVGVELDTKVRDNILRKIKRGCYAGRRHQARLPVRGQRTSSNARTARKNSFYYK